MYKVRRTTPHHAYLLHEELSTWKDDFPFDPAYENHFWLASTSQNVPVGYTSLKVIDAGSAVFLSYAIVSPAHQKKGLHKRYLRVREAWTRKHGIPTIITYTAKDNYNSWQNLVKHGYRIYHPAYEFVGKDYFYFRKDL